MASINIQPLSDSPNYAVAQLTQRATLETDII